MRTKLNKPTRVKLQPPPVQLCEWFLNCAVPATGTTSHPVLGSVPTCDKCARFAADHGVTGGVPPMIAARMRSRA